MQTEQGINNLEGNNAYTPDHLPIDLEKHNGPVLAITFKCFPYAQYGNAFFISSMYVNHTLQPGFDAMNELVIVVGTFPDGITYNSLSDRNNGSSGF